MFWELIQRCDKLESRRKELVPAVIDESVGIPDG
jgi:hypothetical protein